MSAISHKEKAQITKAWLEELFDGQPVPIFGKSEEATDKLYDIMMCQKKIDRDRETYLHYLERSRDEYAAETRDMHSVLSKMGLKTDGLPDSLQAHLSSLASIANKLRLGNISEASFTVALSDLVVKKEQTSSNLELESQAVSKLNDEIKSGLLLIRQLEQLIDYHKVVLSTSGTKMQEQSREADFLKLKIEKYSADTATLDRELSSSGMHPRLTHKSIMQDYEKLQELQRHLAETKERLRVFEDLPPDKHVARVKLEVARSKLADIESELAKHIDMFHL